MILFMNCWNVGNSIELKNAVMDQYIFVYPFILD